MSKTLSFFLLLLLPVLTLADSHGHAGLSARSRHSRIEPLRKRAQGTFYATGLGACGGTNSDSDFIVALNKEQFDQGGWCYKDITINFKGKSAQAQVVDRCEGCGWGNIDLSPGLFSFLSGSPLSAILNIGILQLDWHVNGGGGNDNPPPPKPTPKPTTTHKTTSDTPKPTKTQTSETKSHPSTSSSPSSTHSTTASSSSSASSTAQSTVPIYTPAPPSVKNIADLKDLMVGMGQLVLSARS